MPVTVEPPIRSELHVQTICLSVLTVVAVGFALWWLQPVMIPFVIAAFFSIALMPLVDRLEIYMHAPRTVAACVALLLALLALVGMGVLTRTAVVQITDSAGQYQQQLESMLDSVAESPPFRWLSKHLGGGAHGVKPPATTTQSRGDDTPDANSDAGSSSKSETTSGTKPDIVIPPPKKEADGTGLDQSREADRSPATSTETTDANLQHERASPWSLIPNSAIQTFLINASRAALGIVQQSVIVLIFMFFLMMSSVKRDHPIGGAWGEMEDRIRAYLITMTTLAAVTGAMVGAVLSILGVQAAVLFGLLTFLLNFIPNVGSFISILLPIPFILLSPTMDAAEKIMAIAIPAAIQFFIGNFIQPKLMGEHMKLHPVVILMSLIFWGMLWGIVGAFLAVPITSIIRIACDRHALTKPVAKLMAGKLDALREEPIVVAEQVTVTPTQ